MIIGANGFIGSHLVDELVRRGHTVRAFDRFSSQHRSYVSDQVESMAGDFLNDADLKRAVLGQDVVYHFLSTTTPATAQADPTMDVRTNVAQSIALLQSCVQVGVRRVYFASTGGAIYGDQSLTEYKEEDATLPISPYGIGKLSIENYLRYFRVTEGLESVVLRISNPYGPRQTGNRGQGLIPIALKQIAAGNPVVRLGDGSMVRDYLYVEDLVRMIGLMSDTEPRHSMYNLGSGHGASVNEVLTVIGEVLGREFKIVGRDSPATYVSKVILNTDRFHDEFRDTNLTSLHTGIANTLQQLPLSGMLP
ncbi:NAD-dependent epimerase/dehydratase family protein [Cryobacterium sp. MP_3.1]|uniref:NAD-dependent epimerase/dehydratase family protein n=1 Tax=Cryobacterium sp. MP_3.1 TaxID=3071711 RepID=UPI002E0EBCDD